MALLDRHLRATAQPLTQPDWDMSLFDMRTRERILEVAARLIAEHGRPGLTLSGLAHAMVSSTRRIRRFFSDIDAILAELILNHLTELHKSLAPLACQSGTERRQAYLNATRGIGELFSPAHRLMLTQTHNLPPDLRAEVIATRNLLAPILGLPDPGLLEVMDSEFVSSADVEDHLELACRRLYPQAAPAPQPSPAPSEAKDPTPEPKTPPAAQEIPKPEPAKSEPPKPEPAQPAPLTPEPPPEPRTTPHAQAPPGHTEAA